MNSQIDSSIPVLTEIINTSAQEVVIEIPKLEAQVRAQTPTEITNTILPNPVPTSTETTGDASELNSMQLSDEQFNQLEHKLREEILTHVLQRVDFVLEHRIRDGLADVLQSAVDDLAIQIRTGLRNSLDELVRRSVNQELNKIKLSK
jgi:hypothetical protein